MGLGITGRLRDARSSLAHTGDGDGRLGGDFRRRRVNGLAGLGARLAADVGGWADDSGDERDRVSTRRPAVALPLCKRIPPLGYTNIVFSVKQGGETCCVASG